MIEVEKAIEIINKEGKDIGKLVKLICNTLKKRNENLGCICTVDLQKNGECGTDFSILMRFGLTLEGKSFNEINSTHRVNRKGLKKKNLIGVIENFKSQILTSLIYTQTARFTDSMGEVEDYIDLRSF